MTIEDIYERLEAITEKYKLATKDSFEQETKNGKKLFNSILDLKDQLQNTQPSDELFDDDELFNDEETIEDQVSPNEDKNDDLPKKLLVDDLLGEDDDEIW
jgi:hypothetical protein